MEKNFSALKASRQVLGPSQPSIKRILEASSTQVKHSECEANHSSVREVPRLKRVQTHIHTSENLSRAHRKEEVEEN